MNEQDYIDLSKRVAEKLGIEAYIDRYPNEDMSTDMFWLHQDPARCFDLLGEHDMQLTHFSSIGYVEVPAFTGVKNYREFYVDHNNDRNLAARVAILRALEAM